MNKVEKSVLTPKWVEIKEMVFAFGAFCFGGACLFGLKK